MNDVVAADFPAFFAALRGGSAAPFPWQTRLLNQLGDADPTERRSGLWPSLLDLPTASGKTATIDIAVFLMALSAAAPRRVVFVVDRRVIVQQAAVWAGSISRSLRDAPSDGDHVLSRVARALRARRAPLGDDGEPLVVAELRGAVERDERWAERPDQPAVVVSTVDQVGSRLLNQGYGVSPGMRPVHAGLLSNDVLFLLDEVHVSQPFAETLQQVSALRQARPWPGHDTWQVCQLSATPGASVERRGRFALDGADRASDLALRTGVHKRVRLVEVKVEANLDARSHLLGSEAARLALAELDNGVRCVAVVVNRVATAVRTARSVRELRPDLDTVLLTGRMRGGDRDRLLGQVTSRIASGRERRDSDRPLVVVGTQSIEVGADFDVDLMVTECASLDALKQRFGRVDRLGRLAASGREPTHTVFAPSRLDADDPVYGASVAATWAWLNESPRDFGVDFLDEVAPDALATMTTPRRHAPTLMPSHLDRWWQRDAPDCVPVVADWLHGVAEGRVDGDVNLVWRAGLLRADGSGLDDSYTRNALAALPPAAHEAMPVPLSRVRRWLGGDRHGHAFDDVEYTLEVEEEDSPTGKSIPHFLWRPDDEERPDARLRVGDTVVVDASAGGIALGSTWDPGSTEPVTDLATPADSGVLRLDRAVLRPERVGSYDAGAADNDVADELWRRLPSPDVEDPTTVDSHVVESVVQWLGELATSPPAPALADVSSWGSLRRLRVRDVVFVNGDGRSCYFVLKPRAVGAFSLREGASFAAAQQVELATHLADTRCWALGFATQCGVDEQHARALADAAERHDLGKLDPRFQLMLREGALPSGGPLLAKSGIPAADRGRIERARTAAGYPRHASHAALGAWLVRAHDAVDGSASVIVRHLVASHHGQARPFVEPVGSSEAEVPVFSAKFGGATWAFDGAISLADIGNGIPEDYWSSVRDLGWFAEVWLSAFVRLADHRASEFPTRTVGGGQQG